MDGDSHDHQHNNCHNGGHNTKKINLFDIPDYSADSKYKPLAGDPYLKKVITNTLRGYEPNELGGTTGTNRSLHTSLSLVSGGKGFAFGNKIISGFGVDVPNMTELSDISQGGFFN